MEAAKVCSLSPSNYVQPVLLTTQSFVLPPFPPIFPFSFVNHYLLNYPTWHTAVPSPSTLHIPDHGMGTVSGTLKGFDPLVNLVLDNTTEYLRGELIYFFRFILSMCLERQPVWCACTPLQLLALVGSLILQIVEMWVAYTVALLFSYLSSSFFFFFPFLPISSLLSPYILYLQKPHAIDSHEWLL